MEPKMMYMCMVFTLKNFINLCFQRNEPCIIVIGLPGFHSKESIIPNNHLCSNVVQLNHLSKSITKISLCSTQIAMGLHLSGVLLVACVMPQ